MKRKLLFATALLLSATTFAQTGGPDTYGYIYENSNATGGPVYNWIEIDPNLGGAGITNAALANDDDNSSHALSFNFSFYGEVYDSVKIATNGALTFGAELDYFGLSNVCMPNASGYADSAVIAAFWDDLDPSSGGAIYFQDFGTYAVIEYSDVVEFGGADGDSWEVILYDNGRILMQFKETSAMQVNTGYTVGIQGNSTTGLGYLCDGTGDSMSDNLAILWKMNDASLVELNKSDVSIYPNPNNGSFKLSISSISNDVSVTISDIQGRAVYTNHFDSNEVEEMISLEDVDAGIYTVSVNNGSSIVTERVIVK